MTAHPPAGFHGSAAFAFDGAAWFGAGYLDWYLVDGFAALGAINEAAIAGPRQQSHDVVASLANSGAGGVARLLAGAGALDEIRWGAWFAKPDGMRYAALRARVAPLADAHGGSLWQRQMVLGPGPEFCLFTKESTQLPTEFAPVSLKLRPVWSSRFGIDKV